MAILLVTIPSLVAQEFWEGTWRVNGNEMAMVRVGRAVYGVSDDMFWFGRVYPGGRRLGGTYLNTSSANAGRFDVQLNGDNLSLSGFIAAGEDMRGLDTNNAMLIQGQKLDGNSPIINVSSTSGLAISTAGFVVGILEDERVFFGKLRSMNFQYLLANVTLTRLNNLTMQRSDAGADGEILLIANNETGKLNLTASQRGAIDRHIAAKQAEEKKRQADLAKVEASLAKETNASTTTSRLKITLNSVNMTKARFGNRQTGQLELVVIINGPESRMSKVAVIGNHPRRFHYTNQGISHSGATIEQMGSFSTELGTRWTQNQERKSNKSVTWRLDLTRQEIQASRFALTVDSRFNWGPNLLAADMWAFRTNNLVEIMKYLSGETQVSDYPSMGGTRRRLPNSDDEIYLESMGGKRFVRIKSDVYDDKNHVRFTTNYTLELIN